VPLLCPASCYVKYPNVHDSLESLSRLGITLILSFKSSSVLNEVLNGFTIELNRGYGKQILTLLRLRIFPRTGFHFGLLFDTQLLDTSIYSGICSNAFLFSPGVYMVDRLTETALLSSIDLIIVKLQLSCQRTYNCY